MGKPANPKRTTDKEARAYGKFLKTSERKLNLVAQMIRGQKAGKALTDLQFSKRRIAQEVRKVLQSAVSNAENNHGLDVDRLVVATATVGKQIKMKRYHARARGRAAPVVKKFSNLTIIVREQDAAEAKPKKAKVNKSAEAKAKPAKAKKESKKSEQAQGA